MSFSLLSTSLKTLTLADMVEQAPGSERHHTVAERRKAFRSTSIASPPTRSPGTPAPRPA
jgi:hypothetical protein